ncbi:MAG: hypothetical protein WAP03_21780 [Methylorubrum rhodinum]|uniref:hypothetical protein n=1 Tax=Methylorubrum rhodinum TaxID=29428 RepID=UPI003BB08EAC
MSNRRSHSWSNALRDLRGDRVTPNPIREERLRSFAGMRGSTSIALSAWRGLSGRRYVVGVQALAVEAAEEALPAVLIAVRRNDAGLALLPIDLYSGAAGEPDVAEWVARSLAQGATELHIHRLAEGADGRTAVVADLTAPATAEAA